MRFGWLEILLIAGLILLVFGPKRFGQIGKSTKEGFREFKKETQPENDDQREDD